MGFSMMKWEIIVKRKKLCVVANVFGEKYMSYIPFYVYSIYKAYPEYDVRVYISENIPSDIQAQLDYLRENGCKNYVIKKMPNFDELTKKAKKNINVKKAYRWLYFDAEFYNYNAVYIGDIDIFICKEKEGIYEQHLRHCNALGIPYSNLARKKVYEKNYKRLASAVMKYGPCVALHNYKKGIYTIKRLTGLHFFKIEEDFCSKIRAAIDEVIKELNEIFGGTHKEISVLDINTDEWILYRIIQKAGYKIYEPESLEETKFNTDCSKIIFRPHHGIHAGAFKNYEAGKNLTQKMNNVIESLIYQNYYAYYKELKKEDKILQRLLCSKTYAAKVFQKVSLYYENRGKQVRT